jgi:4-amino-4-deoxy-L-arabinose transferase-like glycosyltransferase
LPQATDVMRLLDWIEQRPDAAFAVFAVLHVAVWTALPAAFYLNLPLDLIEAQVYGREWQLGYDKLPPLPWGLIEVVNITLGKEFLYYALAQLVVFASFALIWLLALPLVGATGALLSVLILDGMHYFNFTAVKFNHDVVQLPFWSLAGFSFWAALRRQSMVYWVLLGLSLGGALWAKYFVIVLAAPLALFLLFNRDARKALATPGPYIAATVALIVAAPHLIWLVQNDFLPFRYADARAAPVRGAFDHVLRPLQFFVGQLFFAAPALIIAMPLVFLRGEQRQPAPIADAFDRHIVTLLAFGPAAAVTALSLVSGRGTVAMWGYPLWLFTGLWIVLRAGAITRVALKWAVTIWAAVSVLFVAAFVGHFGVRPHLGQHYFTELFPGEHLAREVSSRFRTTTGQPLTYVIGRMWDGGNVSYYAPEHPRVLIDGDPRRAPWIDLADLKARGAVVIWTHAEPRVIPEAFRAFSAGAEVQPPLQLPFRLGSREVTVGWAVLRPQVSGR